MTSEQENKWREEFEEYYFQEGYSRQCFFKGSSAREFSKINDANYKEHESIWLSAFQSMQAEVDRLKSNINGLQSWNQHYRDCITMGEVKNIERIKKLEEKLKEASDIFNCLELENDHFIGCPYPSKECLCMDRSIYNLDSIRERARQWQEVIDNEN